MCLLLAAVTVAGLRAQTDDEYLMEVGGGIGVMSYQGDFNGSLFGNMQPMFSLQGRRLFGPWMGLQASIGYGTAKGSAKDAGSYHPDESLQPLSYEFSNRVIDGSVRFEYNFWPFGTGREYRGAQPLTPFAFVGLGGTYVDTGNGGDFALSFPIGVGVKYKLAPRLNLAAEWAMHFTGSDKLDSMKDPMHVISEGSKNKDSFSCLQVTLTYSFMARCRTCHNADEY